MEDSQTPVMVVIDRDTTSKLRYSDSKWEEVKQAVSKAGLTIDKVVYDVYLILGTIAMENMDKLCDIEFVQTVEIEGDDGII